MAISFPIPVVLLKHAKGPWMKPISVPVSSRRLDHIYRVIYRVQCTDAEFLFFCILNGIWWWSSHLLSLGGQILYLMAGKVRNWMWQVENVILLECRTSNGPLIWLWLYGYALWKQTGGSFLSSRRTMQSNLFWYHPKGINTTFQHPEKGSSYSPVKEWDRGCPSSKIEGMVSIPGTSQSPKETGPKTYLDLRGLNQFIVYKKIRMVSNILLLFQEGIWMATLDLKDAYF